jgi:hypothetical protein
MVEPSETEIPHVPGAPGIDAGIYIDSSALVKLYMPEAESERPGCASRSGTITPEGGIGSPRTLDALGTLGQRQNSNSD